MSERFIFVPLKIVSKILSLILMAIIMFNSLRISLTYAYYYFDKADFIEMLCVNKDKPEMHCNGQCHLKKMVEGNNNNDKAPHKDINFKEITLFVVEQAAYNFINISFKKAELSYYTNLYAYATISTLDHPPQV